MAGFAAGLAQGFGNFADDLAADRVRREESQMRQIAAARQAQLDQAKQVGDLIKNYSDAIATLPEDQVAVRTDLFKQQIEAATGTKIDPAVWKTMKSDPKGTAEAMTQMYVDKPFTPKALGGVLGNINAFTGLYDALQNRKQNMDAAAAFGQGVGAPQTSGTPQAQPAQLDPIAAIDAQMAQLQQAAAQLSSTGQLDKQRTSFLEKRLDILQKQREQLLTGDTEGMRRDQQQMTFQEAQAAGVPVGTTYGEFRRMRGGGAARPSPVAAQPNVQGSPIAARGASGFSAVPAKGSTPPAILDNLRATESSGNQFAINKQTKAMGPYQFMPETLAEMTKAGISFNPFDEPQARDAADRYITMLAQRHGGDYRKALADYGGFITKDPTAYVNKVMKGVQEGGTQAAATTSNMGVPLSEAQLAQNKAIAEGGAKTFNDMRTNAGKARQNESQLKTLGSMLDQVRTGTGASSLLGLRKLAAAAGFDIDPSANYAEAARGLAVHLIGQSRDAAGGVGATSNYEDQLYQMGVPNIDKLPGANKILVAAAVKHAKRTQEIFKEVSKYVQKNGYDDVGVQEIVDKYVEANPIFSAEDAKVLLGGKSMAEKPEADKRPPLNSFFK